MWFTNETKFQTNFTRRVNFWILEQICWIGGSNKTKHCTIRLRNSRDESIQKFRETEPLSDKTRMDNSSTERIALTEEESWLGICLGNWR